MGIEEMYGDMKRLGIQIPDTQIQDAQRIPRLMLGVALAYVWLLDPGRSLGQARSAPPDRCAQPSLPELCPSWLQRQLQRGRAPPLGLQLYR